jgi:hypothetical protein
MMLTKSIKIARLTMWLINSHKKIAFEEGHLLYNIIIDR